MIDEKASLTSHGLRQVMDYMGLPYRSLIGATWLLLTDTVVSLSIPLIVGLVTALILEQNTPVEISLIQALAIWAALILIQASTKFLCTEKLGRIASRFSADLRSRLYEHIQTLPLNFFQSREHGDILSLLSEDIQRVSQFITNNAVTIAPHLLTLIGATIIVISMDPITGIIALGIVPLELWAIRQTGRAARPLSRELAEQQARHASLTEESLRLHLLTKAFAREKLEIRKYHNSNETLLNTEVKHLRINNRIAPIVQALSGIAVIGLVGFGAYRIHTGTLEPAELVSLIMYCFMLFRPLYSLGTSYGTYQSARGAASRLAELIAEQPEPANEGSASLPPVTHGIHFHKVDFAYPGERTVFKLQDLFVPAKQITALVGQNGVGKTTLIHLLLRFIEPQQGVITVDHINIREYDLRDLRTSIALVPQHVTLINSSIEDNIRYGLPEATHEDTITAARQALVTEFTDKLPDGLDTRVGPCGLKLSGGQQQRVALARALLKKAQIIVMDEPTAMFDPDSEQRLLKHLLGPLRNKTVVIVTHRPAILQLADNVIELSDSDKSMDK